MIMDSKFKQIGLIKTPYTNNAPYQPVDGDKGEFRIVVDTKYAGGFSNLTVSVIST